MIEIIKPFQNEILLVLSLLIIFSGLILWLKLFKKTGLFAFVVLSTILANIEVLILVKAFGLEQTLGNILFAATFLATDILSECYGKKEAQRAVNIGIATSVTFVLISQSWLLYAPAEADFAFPHMNAIFQNTPRLVVSSLVVYAICQRLDVFLYHKIWDFTTKKTGDSRAFLWLRNNGSTLISQLINSFAFNFLAFGHVFDTKTLLSISAASYAVFVVTSIADTPFVYWARALIKREKAE